MSAQHNRVRRQAVLAQNFPWSKPETPGTQRGVSFLPVYRYHSLKSISRQSIALKLILEHGIFAEKIFNKRWMRMSRLTIIFEKEDSVIRSRQTIFAGGSESSGNRPELHAGFSGSKSDICQTRKTS
jgi:hypothetical protein